MQNLISTNHYSPLALLLLVRNNKELSDLAASNDDGWSIADIEDALADKLAIAVNTEDTDITELLLSFFNSLNDWEIIGYETKDDFDNALIGDTVSHIEHFHEAASSKEISLMFEHHQVVKLRTNDGEESNTLRRNSGIVIALLGLKELGIFTEIDLKELGLRYIGSNKADIANIVECAVAKDDDAETQSFVESLKGFNCKVESKNGLIYFNPI